MTWMESERTDTSYRSATGTDLDVVLWGWTLRRLDVVLSAIAIGRLLLSSPPFPALSRLHVAVAYSLFDRVFALALAPD
ncbi:hypothetical protein BHM03_00019945 [Ensete ventricosum]|nr:hypothetical protein BHM03_00019945 [Ensete ventricosum]